MQQIRAAARWATAAIAALVIVACADITPAGPGGPNVNTIPLPPGWVKVCKEGPAGIYNFEAVSHENIGVFRIGVPEENPAGFGKLVRFQVEAGSCVEVYEAGPRPEGLSITEVGPMPTGIQLDFITWQNLGYLDLPEGSIQTVLGTSTLYLEPFANPVAVTFYNKTNEQVGIQGCTPGFWKNSPGSWAATGYATTASFNTVFGVTAFTPDITLMQALNLEGGGIKALARHAVAGLLAASHPDVAYTLTTAEVIAAVQNAIATGTIESTKNTLDRYNNQGCPLANDDSFKN